MVSPKRSRRPRAEPTRLPSDREQALFEAGIKLGGLFHQFIGVPVSPRNARTLARAIESAVELQPFVERIEVRLDPRAGGSPGGGRFGYHYLTAPMVHARIAVRVGDETVVAQLSFREDLRYPLMRVLPSRGPSRGPGLQARKAPRPARSVRR